jgi:hypothetical protein
MTYRSLRRLLGAALVATLPLAACTAAPAPGPAQPTAAPAMRLVAFDSCQQLLTDLRRATRSAIGPYGLSPGGFPEAAALQGARAATDGMSATAGQPAVPAQSYSGTNNHEQNADEPDMVKTDGRRIVLVQDGKLRVIDAAARKQTGELSLGQQEDGYWPAGEVSLFLAGDHALVLMSSQGHAVERSSRRAYQPATISRSELLLVDLTGPPRVLSRYHMDGSLVDARRTGTVARVVLRSTPRLDLPELPNVTDEKRRTAANQKAVDATPVEAWQPAYEITTGSRTVKGRVGCDRISRPAEYSGTSMVTVLSFDLAGAALGDGDPVSIVADGDTVYSTGNNLYVANDQRWRRWFLRTDAVATTPPETEIYRFDTAGAGRPTYSAAGSVRGWLVNQYALSEWDGHLRVATTSDNPFAMAGPDTSAAATPAEPFSESAITVLRLQGGRLAQVGRVDGLGRNERIYSVRFIGPRGYVVTFRQTDPLYSVDLSNPAKPTVTGELKITGYSAHLQPAGDNRLIGIGQEADTQGRTQGTQVSLFDVADPAKPRRLAQHQVRSGHSEAEHDPHALLWWPATNLLVLPVEVYDPVIKPDGPKPTAIALRVTDTGMTRIGSISQPVPGSREVPAGVRRSLVVGDVLWTVSAAGLQASDLSTLETLGWLPTA